MAHAFDDDQVEDLVEAFPALQASDGTIQYDDLRDALQKLGCPVAGHELREMLGPINQRGKCYDMVDVYNLYAKARALKIEPKQIKKHMLLKEHQQVKVRLQFDIRF